MVGWDRGAFALFERQTNQGRNRFQCTLHINELPLRHMGQCYLGDTSGPTGFKGELGKQLEKLKDPEIAAFPAIPNDDFPNIEQEVAKNFSRDQSLLFQACTAVISGVCASAFATVSLGPVNHSRWLTTAIRILF